MIGLAAALRRELERLEPDASLDDLVAFARSAGFPVTREELRRAHGHDWRRRWALIRDAGEEELVALTGDLRRWALMGRLAVDAQTAEVMSAFGAAGAETLLLKGPTIARLLYAGELRPYTDTDLLVSPATFAIAEQTLRELGYERVFGERAMAVECDHGYPWRRTAGGAAVDLHHTLPGVLATPGELWSVLGQHTVAIELHGRTVQALDATALALHVALHAAHHADARYTALRDLELALERFTIAEWGRAAALAARVDAIDAFGVGLRMVPAGRAVADELGLPANSSRPAALRAIGSPPLALWFHRLLTTPGLQAKATLLSRKLWPPADFMRAASPLARRGTAGLVLAYLCRPARLAGQAPSAVRAWRHVGRDPTVHRSTRRSLRHVAAWQAWRNCSRADRRMLVEAASLLLLARLSLKALSFRRTASLFGLRENRSPSTGAPTAPPEAAVRAAWAVLAAATRMPFEGTCLSEALAGSAMLARRRIPATLHLGVAGDPLAKDRLCAHAWLRCGEAVLTGATGCDGFTPICAFDVGTVRSGERQRTEHPAA